MHCLYGLEKQGLKFEMKGGTSLNRCVDPIISLAPPFASSCIIFPTRRIINPVDTHLLPLIACAYDRALRSL